MRPLPFSHWLHRSHPNLFSETSQLLPFGDEKSACGQYDEPLLMQSARLSWERRAAGALTAPVALLGTPLLFGVGGACLGPALGPYLLVASRYDFSSWTARYGRSDRSPSDFAKSAVLFTLAGPLFFGAGAVVGVVWGTHQGIHIGIEAVRGDTLPELVKIGKDPSLTVCALRTSGSV